MLYVSLCLSGLILVGCLLAVRYAKHPVAAALLWAVGLTVLPVGGLAAFPAVFIQTAILVTGVLIAAGYNRGRRALLPLSIIAPVIAYSVVGWSVVAEYRQDGQARERLLAAYPFESVEHRLPRPVPPSSPGDRLLLDRLEQSLDRESRSGRSASLYRLHENTVTEFVNSPEFGYSRMKWVPVREVPEESRADTPPQADYFHPGLAEPNPAAAPPSPRALDELHEASFLDFVNAGGFGYVKDRRHVAGFQSHGFSKTPGPVEKWEVARLELVGLLLHEKPVVYLSPKLPRMDELKGAPTRTPDAFESAALEKFRAGADLHVGDGADASRFVGAVRSTKQCVACHGGERGALLGAFTYRLRPVR